MTIECLFIVKLRLKNGWNDLLEGLIVSNVYLMPHRRLFGDESLVTTCKIKLFEQCALCAKWLKITSFVFITCLWNIRNTRLPLHTPPSHPKSYIIIFLSIKKAIMHKENINFSTYLYRMMSYLETWERLYIYVEVYSQSWMSLKCMCWSVNIMYEKWWLICFDSLSVIINRFQASRHCQDHLFSRCEISIFITFVSQKEVDCLSLLWYFSSMFD